MQPETARAIYITRLKFQANNTTKTRALIIILSQDEIYIILIPMQIEKISMRIGGR